MSSEHDPKTLHVKSSDFYAGYQQATLDYEQEYKPKGTPFDDIQITTIFTQIAYGTPSDLWKAGYFAGLFATLYGVPYTWTFGPEINVLQILIPGIRKALGE